MAKKTLSTINPEKNVEKSDSEQAQFTQNIICMNAIGLLARNPSDIDKENALQDARIGQKALHPNGAMQEMLVAQMLSIHELQQKAVIFATRSNHDESIKYYTNAAIKLANCFTQQANMLSKLQGHGQKITVERVDVHQGGQAIVGSVIEK